MSQILLVEESEYQEQEQVTETALEQLKIYLLKKGDKRRIKAVSSIQNKKIHMKKITMLGGRADRVTRNSDHWSDLA
ncbi:MAG TPA: hypothetical protein VF220_01420 [Nitrososphaeraceae archaeon]